VSSIAEKIMLWRPRSVRAEFDGSCLKINLFCWGLFTMLFVAPLTRQTSRLGPDRVSSGDSSAGTSDPKEGGQTQPLFGRRQHGVS
jgi:hypothetical protein